MVFRNKKNGKLYRTTIDVVTNATNSQDGQTMVLYYEIHSDRDEWFVRERGEFYEKFEPVLPETKGEP